MRLRATAAAGVCAISLASAGLVHAAPAAAPGLSNRLSRALAGPYLPMGRTAAIAVDLETGTVLFAHNDAKPVVPASNEKLPVAWTALVELGPAYRFHTELYGVGSREGNTWDGDLVLKGYGDPTLSAAELLSLARQVAAAGIKHVSGRILGDETWFDARRTGVGWKAKFYLHESPALSALIVDRGWTGHYETGRPALYAAQLFRLDLRHAGVGVSGGAGLGVAAADAAPLGEVQSPRLAALIRHMDVYSDNFFAEMLMKEVGAVQGSGGSAAAGLVVTRRLLTAAGVPLTGVRMVDGSGLSLLDRWTPSGLATLLRTMWDDPDLRPYVVPALPVAGKTGTLDYRMRTGPAHGFVRAKTGTTDNSSALSGFVGDRYVFSILENGHPVRTRSAERSQNRFAQVLARAAQS